MKNKNPEPLYLAGDVPMLRPGSRGGIGTFDDPESRGILWETMSRLSCFS